MSSAPASNITQAEVMGTTNLDPDGGAPSIGINMPGALLRIRVPAQAGGLIPDATKFTITTSDPGFDNAGSVISSVSRTRTLVPFKNVSTQAADLASPTAMLRRIAPNEAVVLAVQSGSITAPGSLVAGTAVDWYVVLPDYVYQGTTSITATVASGWYGTAASGSLPTITNSSNKVYPHPIWGFINDPCERIEASTYNVELWCNGHRHARAGQAVAGVSLWATDGTNTSTPTVATATALGALQTREAIAEVFKVAVALSGVNDTDGSSTLGTGLQTVDGYIYPWIGTRYQLSVDGLTWPVAQPCCPLPFVKDTAGKYGGAIAYVNPGVAGASPSVSRTAAANYAAALVQAYGTYSTAAAAISAFNNASTGRPASAIIHNDRGGGEVRILLNTPSVAQAFELNGNEAQAAGNCWTTILSAPENSGAVAFYSMANARLVNTLLRCDGMDITRSAASACWNGNDTTSATATMLAWRNATLTWNAGTTGLWLQNAGFLCLRNMNLAYGSAKPTGVSAFGVGSQGTSKLKCIRTIGVTLGDSTAVTANLQNLVPYMAVGVSGKFALIDPSVSTQTTNDGFIFDNCKSYAIEATGNFLNNYAMVRGCYVGQSVIEYIAGNDWGPAGNTTATVDTDNLLLDYITEPYDRTCTDAASLLASDLGRINHCYDMAATTRGHRRYGSNHYNFSGREASKSDVFAYRNNGSVTGCTGNFEVAYNVSHEGNCLAIVRPATFTAIDYWRKVVDTASADNIGAIAFTNNQAGAAQVGFGTYTIPNNSPLKNKVPAGHSRRSFDLAGAARKNDGTGAAGAYEAAP